MSRTNSFAGPSRLSQVIASLRAGPILELQSLQRIKLTLAAKNDHFGARHFVKEQLPRIRHTNPNLRIDVAKVSKIATATWKPEMVLTFNDGEVRALDLHEKWSTTIVKELMDVAGGPAWQQWKTKAIASGQPLVPGEELAGQKTAKKAQRPPTWKKPPYKREPTQSDTTTTSPSEHNSPEGLELMPKTGAAAVLP